MRTVGCPARSDVPTQHLCATVPHQCPQLLSQILLARVPAGPKLVGQRLQRVTVQQ